MKETALRVPRARCRLGAGRTDITPAPDAYHRNWGAALHDRAAGIHRPLLASALVLDAVDGDRGESVLVALDLGWLRRAEMAQLLDRLRAATGLDGENLMVTFSHTHAAANLDRERASDPGGEHIAPYLEALPQRILAAIEEARAALTPAELVFGHGRCDLAMNRDCRDDERDIYVCGPNPGTSCDDLVTVGRATALDDGRPLCTLVNYACHATTLAWENELISPDYVGAMREVVEGVIPAPCIFLQGAAGDLGPRYGFVGDAAVADANGRQLGYAALSALTALPPPGRELHYQGPVISGATLGVWRYGEAGGEAIATYRTRELALDLALRDLPSREELQQLMEKWRGLEDEARHGGDEKAVRDCRAQVERARRAMRRREELSDTGRTQYGVALWQVGQAAIALLGGEPYSLLQRRVRERLPDTPVLVVELCNHSHSYILPEDQYGKGLYQDDCATLAPGGLETIADAIGDSLEAWGLS